MGPQPNDCPPVYLESSILARGGQERGGVVTLDTNSKMYSDKQAQDTIGPPHRWQILQRSTQKYSQRPGFCVAAAREVGGYLAMKAPNVGISQHYIFSPFEMVTVSD